ncbi:hypothetical protein BC829DRAFT_439973 [Chytridium lagenaria]|nr:hypothetical protein BC829DRAFT_439973 [Chytridium lagenaria]
MQSKRSFSSWRTSPSNPSSNNSSPPPCPSSDVPDDASSSANVPPLSPQSARKEELDMALKLDQSPSFLRSLAMQRSSSSPGISSSSSSPSSSFLSTNTTSPSSTINTSSGFSVDTSTPTGPIEKSERAISISLFRRRANTLHCTPPSSTLPHSLSESDRLSRDMVPLSKSNQDSSTDPCTSSTSLASLFEHKKSTRSTNQRSRSRSSSDATRRDQDLERHRRRGLDLAVEPNLVPSANVNASKGAILPAFLRPRPKVPAARTFKGPVGRYIDAVTGLPRMRFEVERALFQLSSKKLAAAFVHFLSVSLYANSPFISPIKNPRIIDPVPSLGQVLGGIIGSPDASLQKKVSKKSRTTKTGREIPKSNLRLEVGRRKDEDVEMVHDDMAVTRGKVRWEVGGEEISVGMVADLKVGSAVVDKRIRQEKRGS